MSRLIVVRLAIRRSHADFFNKIDPNQTLISRVRRPTVCEALPFGGADNLSQTKLKILALRWRGITTRRIGRYA